MGRILARAIFILSGLLLCCISPELEFPRSNIRGWYGRAFIRLRWGRERSRKQHSYGSVKAAWNSIERGKSHRDLELLRVPLARHQKWLPIAHLIKEIINFEDFWTQISFTELRRECRSCDSERGVKCLKNHLENCLRATTKRGEASNFLLLGARPLQSLPLV